jgi:glycosyltransferase involved in cell wall biosynthesis
VLLFGAYPISNKLIKGGVEASVYGLATQLHKTPGIDVKVIAYPKKNIKKDIVQSNDGFDTFFFANPYKTELLSFLRLWKIIGIIKKYRPNVVHLHGTHLIDFLLILFLKTKGYNYVLTVHGILTVEHKMDYRRHRSVGTLLKYFIYSFFEYLCIRLAFQIIVDTFYVKQWMLKKRFAPDRHIHIIPQGINDKYYHIPDAPVPDTLLSIGSITERKGYIYAIQAVAKLISKHPDIKYYIIGFCQNAGYYESMAQLITKLGLANHVFILMDTDTAVIQKHLSEACVFILHSQEESQGIAFCEAMAVGKPIVATNVGGIPYVVKNDINGLLSPFADVETFACNINELLQNEAKRLIMKKKNKTEAVNYRWDNITASILSVYN